MSMKCWLTAMALLGAGACSGKLENALPDGGGMGGTGRTHTGGAAGTVTSGTGGTNTGGSGGAIAGGGSGTGGNAGAAGCSEVPIWTQQSQGFEIASSGGYVEPPPSDAGCANTYTNYGFSLANRTLTEDGCNYKGRFGYGVHLTQAGLDSVVAALSVLHSTCTLGCGADAPDETLTLQSAGAAVLYNGSFYAGCSYTTPLSPPFIHYDDLWSFETQLQELITDACNPTDAGGASLGTCG